MLTHGTLRRRFHSLCRRLSAPVDDSVYRTKPTGFGDPFVEIDADQYHYVIEERGQELEKRSTADADELLYWLISDVVFRIALAYELQHRVSGQDSRRIVFQRSTELLSMLSPAWAVRGRDEIDAILVQAPYSDGVRL